MKRRLITSGLALGSITAVLLSCAAGNAHESAHRATDGRPFLVYEASPESEGSFGALINGRLVLRDGCLYVDQANDAGRVTPVLPDTATWDAEAETLTLGANSWTVGDTVEFGGGEAFGENVPRTGPDACAGEDAFLVQQ